MRQDRLIVADGSPSFRWHGRNGWSRRTPVLSDGADHSRRVLESVCACGFFACDAIRMHALTKTWSQLPLAPCHAGDAISKWSSFTFFRSGSSAGQSNGLLIRGAAVRIRLGTPDFFVFLFHCLQPLRHGFSCDAEAFFVYIFASYNVVNIIF